MVRHASQSFNSHFVLANELSLYRFVFLSRNFNYSSWTISLATKVSIHQFIFTPIFNTYFFGMQALLMGESGAQAWRRIKATVPASFADAMKIWPIATAFSFTYVPMESRAVFNGIVGLGWQTYLAYMNRKAEEREGIESRAKLDH